MRQVKCTKREWKLICPSCETRINRWAWDYELNQQLCETCNIGLEFYVEEHENAPSIATDGIPGGIEIRHGLVHHDMSPMKFYSKTELKRAANEYGLTIMGDTPNKTGYKVNWSGIRKTRPDEVYDKKQER